MLSSQFGDENCADQSQSAPMESDVTLSPCGLRPGEASKGIRQRRWRAVPLTAAVVRVAGPSQSARTAARSSRSGRRTDSGNLAHSRVARYQWPIHRQRFQSRPAARHERDNHFVRRGPSGWCRPGPIQPSRPLWPAHAPANRTTTEPVISATTKLAERVS